MHLKIIGRVQGVGFRYAMCTEARRLRVIGWVRNRSDGTVEAVAAGEQAALQQLAQWAQSGPAGSEVKDVQVRAATDAEATNIDNPFSLRATV